MKDNDLLRVIDRLIFWMGIGCIFIFAMLPSSSVCKEHQIQGVRIWPSPESTRVVLDLDGPVTFEQKEDKSPDGRKRVILIIKKVVLKTKLSDCVLENTRIKQIRSELKNKDELRLIVELEKPLKPNSFTLPPNQPYGHRLVLDLEDQLAVQQEVIEALEDSGVVMSTKQQAEKEAILALFAEDGENVKPKISQGSVIAKEPEMSNTAAISGTDNTSTVVQASKALPVKTLGHEPKRPFIVAIDAGHGGEDPGSIGRFGTREKDVVLQISKYLKAMIDQEKGMKAVLIRSGDYYVGLYDRTRRARKHKADLFISIHADAFQDRRAEGASVFTLSERGASSTAAKWIADRENRSDLIGGVKLANKNKVLASVLLDLTQSASKEEGLRAADLVLQSLGKVGSLHNGQVEQAGFAVLKAPDVPSLLVETGFISHPATERKLKSAAYQKKIAAAIMGGIRQYARKRHH